MYIAPQTPRIVTADVDDNEFRFNIAGGHITMEAAHEEFCADGRIRFVPGADGLTLDGLAKLGRVLRQIEKIAAGQARPPKQCSTTFTHAAQIERAMSRRTHVHVRKRVPAAKRPAAVG